MSYCIPFSAPENQHIVKREFLNFQQQISPQIITEIYLTYMALLHGIATTDYQYIFAKTI
ncbi:hypothetical protein HmCmsJML285_4078 [Escherichia coli]|nr:hypothetical protein HmCmsJML285_4078 [Escherichia coli]